MSKYSYKITDIDALAAKYPEAVQTIKTPNRVEISKLWRAAQVLGTTIPGVEAFETEDVLESIPAHMAEKADNA